MDLSDYMAIPYVVVVYSVERPDGEWVRRVEYPELPGCAAEDDDVLTAIDRADAERVRFLASAFARGDEIPVPRPPLKCRTSGLSDEPVVTVLERMGM